VELAVLDMFRERRKYLLQPWIWLKKLLTWEGMRSEQMAWNEVCQDQSVLALAMISGASSACLLLVSHGVLMTVAPSRSQVLLGLLLS
jgi:hypothetical protein